MQLSLVLHEAAGGLTEAASQLQSDALGTSLVPELSHHLLVRLQASASASQGCTECTESSRSETKALCVASTVCIR